MQISTKLINISPTDNGYLLSTDGPAIKLIFLADNILRIRASFDKIFAEESYTLVMTAWEDRFDKLLGNERQRVQALELPLEDNPPSYTIRSKKLTVHIQKEPFAIRVLDADGLVLHEDLAGRAFVLDYKKRISHYAKLNIATDRFYGFGERTGGLNKTHDIMFNSPKDSIGHDPSKTNYMYKHIPFYLKLNSQNFKATGFFYHNTYESMFNIGAEISGYWDRYTYFCADGGDIDLFIIAGATSKEVLSGYADLTGKPALPTMKSLGYLGSSMYYVELPSDCDQEVQNFIKKNHELGIPVDGFQLSSGYTVGANNKRYVFYWNTKRFPVPESFFKEMKELGVPVSPNLKPGILLDHPFMERFESAAVFIKDSANKEAYIDKWWGGPAKFFDFSNPAARLIWQELLQEQLISLGITSIWNDNCEYDSLLDKEATCNFEGSFAKLARLKAVLPNLMNYSSWQALLAAYPKKRPYLISRSGFAGIQRYAQTWAGDNYTSWDTMRYNLNTIMGLGLSGVPNNGCDVGGFYGPHPDAELFVRWVQSGIFYPRFSIHSSNTDNTVTEAWMYGAAITKLVRAAILFRYKLLPYIYSVMSQSSKDAEVLMRPLFYDFQDPEVFNCEELFQFMFGPAILVANVLESKAKSRRVYLPAGCNWYDFYTLEKFSGGQYIDIDVNLASIPLFLHDGVILPHTDDIFSIGRDPIETLKLLVTIGRDSEFVLYEDDGVSILTTESSYLETKITVRTKEQRTKISFQYKGSYPSPIKNILIEVINQERGAYWVERDGQRLPQTLDQNKFLAQAESWSYNGINKSVLIKYPYQASDHELVLSYQNFDLMGI